MPSQTIDKFLEPLDVDLCKLSSLSESFMQNFDTLAAESKEQFLGTPVSESILRSVSQHGHGR